MHWRRMMGKKFDTYVVIMAGGGGTRFWPWSREKRPKQILPILSDRTMIRETVERVRPLLPRENIFVVTAKSQIAALRKEIPEIPAENLLAEPQGRNTAPCISLAAIHILNKNPQGVMVVLPADHYIGNHPGFLKSLRAAVAFARKNNFLTTLGVSPTEPEIGYGYIEKGEILEIIGGVSVYKTKSFREKPTRAKAAAYLRTGKFLWNSGIFIWRADVFWSAVKKLLPDLYGEMTRLAHKLGTPGEKKVLQTIYSRCPSISVDYGILEKAENVAMIEARFSWSDVGSWSALKKILPQDKEGNVQILCRRTGKGRILLLESSNCLARSEEKLVVLVGMKDTVVVEAGNAFLVCPRDRSQDVRRVLEELRNQGWKEYL
jgi:mannose-1-phosphate guanylyltransferase